MRLSLLLIVLLLTLSAAGQHGTADSGYYPMGYNGDTWTGEVISVNDDTREITLKYSKNDKTETFVATLPANFTVATPQDKQKKLKPSDIPLGTRVMVYYMTKTKKVEGNKVKVNEVVDIKTPKEKT